MIRFGLFYFLFFASVGVYAPWVPPLLEHHGLDARSIGLALAAASIIRAVTPPLWGVLADRVRARAAILAMTTLAAGLALLGLGLEAGPRVAVFWLLLYALLVAPALPLIETLTLAVLGPAPERYGRVRLWGSLGFIVTSITVGWLVSRTGMITVPLGAGLPLVLAGLLAFGYRSEAARPRGLHLSAALRELPWRVLLPVLVAALLGQASHGPYYAFFSIELAGRGVSSTAIGVLWAVGVAAEVALMAASPRLLAGVDLLAAMRWALALAALRWAVLASTELLWAVAVSQCLHAASYALLHLASVQLVARLSPAHGQALGQALLSAFAYGIGIGAGLALAGELLGAVGYRWLYAIGALLCGAALLAAGLVSSRQLAAASARRG